MAADRAIVRSLLGVFLLLVLTSCTYLHGDRYAMEGAEDGTVSFLTCEKWLPSTVSVWRVGPNGITGDDDDELLWGESDDWVVAADESASLSTTVRWEAGLVASIAATSFPTARLGPLPADGDIQRVDGQRTDDGERSRGEFLERCKDG